MISWDYLAKRRGLTIENVIRTGVTSWDSFQEYCRSRDIVPPSEQSFNEAYRLVNPPVAKTAKPKPVQKAAAKKPAEKPVQKKTRARAKKPKSGT